MTTEEQVETLQHAMSNGGVQFWVSCYKGTYLAQCTGTMRGNSNGNGATMLDAMLAAYAKLYPEGTP